MSTLQNSYMNSSKELEKLKQSVSSSRFSNEFVHLLSSPENTLPTQSPLSTSNSYAYRSPGNGNNRWSPSSESPNIYRTGSNYSPGSSPYYSSQYKTPETSSPSSLSPATSNIILAFRELQAKARLIERDRFESFQERDNLRKKLFDMKKETTIWKSHNDIQATHMMLNAKAANDEIISFQEDLNLKIDAKESHNRSLQRAVMAQESLVASLDDDLARLYDKISQLESRNDNMRAEYEKSKDRCHQMEEVIKDAPLTFQPQIMKLNATISMLESESSDLARAQERATLKYGALKRYMEMVLEVNNDLLNTVVAREESKARIVEMAGKIVPPRYAWPKKLQYPNFEEVMDVISDAATASALEKSAENAALAATQGFKRLQISPNPSSRWRRDSMSDRYKKKNQGHVSDDISLESDGDKRVPTKEEILQLMAHNMQHGSKKSKKRTGKAKTITKNGTKSSNRSSKVVTMNVPRVSNSHSEGDAHGDHNVVDQDDTDLDPNDSDQQIESSNDNSDEDNNIQISDSETFEKNVSSAHHRHRNLTNHYETVGTERDHSDYLTHSQYLSKWNENNNNGMNPDRSLDNNDDILVRRRPQSVDRRRSTSPFGTKVSPSQTAQLRSSSRNRRRPLSPGEILEHRAAEALAAAALMSSQFEDTDRVSAKHTICNILLQLVN